MEKLSPDYYDYKNRVYNKIRVVLGFFGIFSLVHLTLLYVLFTNIN